jgi:hypothetical protein
MLRRLVDMMVYLTVAPTLILNSHSCDPHIFTNKVLKRVSCYIDMLLFLCQRMNTATSAPADDVHNYVIPQQLLHSIFNKLPVFMRQ